MPCDNIWCFTPRSAEDEEQIDLEPEQLTFTTQKQRNMLQARGVLWLQLAENRETLIRRASEQAAFARTVENEHFYITEESVMDANNDIPLCREFSEPGISQISNLQSVLNDHVQIGPVTGIELS